MTTWREAFQHFADDLELGPEEVPAGTAAFFREVARLQGEDNQDGVVAAAALLSPRAIAHAVGGLWALRLKNRDDPGVVGYIELVLAVLTEEARGRGIKPDTPVA